MRAAREDAFTVREDRVFSLCSFVRPFVRRCSSLCWALVSKVKTLLLGVFFDFSQVSQLYQVLEQECGRRILLPVPHGKPEKLERVEQLKKKLEQLGWRLASQAQTTSLRCFLDFLSFLSFWNRNAGAKPFCRFLLENLRKLRKNN